MSHSHLGEDKSPTEPDRVEELMAECLAVPLDEQGSAFGRLCQQHPELAEELKARQAILDRLGMSRSSTHRDFPEKLGDFHLRQYLGGGGMGVVYRAEQISLKREVALKLIRPENVYFPGARERFRREAEAVARLQHPGIVPIYTTGEEGGIPYFAMELIDGLTLSSILEQLAARDPESLEARDLTKALGQEHDTAGTESVAKSSGWAPMAARTVLDIASALEHAHGRGIVHRDVKPSNIAITRLGRARLFDFGLTSTSDSSHLTRTGSQPGTVLYQSPQQVKGLPPEPRDDVYSLGVTLYELLTLQVPFAGKGVEEIRQQVLTGTPFSIRARNRRVPVDLETVCLTAMDPDPARRYASAAAFARDLGNFLEHRPIEARSPGPWIRVRRFIERNKSATAAGALGFLFLTVTPTVLLLRERQHSEVLAAANEKIRQEFETAEESLQFIEDVFRLSTPSEARGENMLVRDVVDRGVARLSSNPTRKAQVVARLFATLGTVYNQLGMHARSVELLERALTLAEGFRGGRDNWTCATIESSLAVSRHGLGDHAGAEQLFRTALARMEKLEPKNSADVNIARNNFANLLIQRGNWKEAEELLRACLPSGEEQGANAGILMGNLALAIAEKEQFSDAFSLFETALTRVSAVKGSDSPEVAALLNNYARAQKLSGDLTRAKANYAECLRILHKLHPEPSEDVAVAELNLAEIQRVEKDFTGAESRSKSGVALLEKLLPAEHPKVLVARFNLASLLWTQRKGAEAVAIYEASIPHARTAFVNTSQEPIVGYGARNLGQWRQQNGKYAEALVLYREAIDIFGRADKDLTREVLWIVVNMTTIWEIQGALGPDEKLIERAEGLARALPGNEKVWLVLKRCLALCALERKDPAAAEALARETLRVAEEKFGDEWLDSYYRGFLGAVLTATGRLDEAESELLAAHAQLTGEAPDFVLEFCVGWIVDLYEKRGDKARAAEWKVKLPRPAGK